MPLKYPVNQDHKRFTIHKIADFLANSKLSYNIHERFIDIQNKIEEK